MTTASNNTRSAIATTTGNLIGSVLIFLVIFLLNEYTLPASLTPTFLMSWLLFNAIHSFWFIGKRGKIEFDKNTIIFWSLFAIGYIALGIYAQAAPSIIGVLVGICAVYFVKKITECRTNCSMGNMR